MLRNTLARWTRETPSSLEKQWFSRTTINFSTASTVAVILQLGSRQLYYRLFAETLQPTDFSRHFPGGSGLSHVNARVMPVRLKGGDAKVLLPGGGSSNKQRDVPVQTVHGSSCSDNPQSSFSLRSAQDMKGSGVHRARPGQRAEFGFTKPAIRLSRHASHANRRVFEFTTREKVYRNFQQNSAST